MATGKVARRADASEVSVLLDSPEVAHLIEQLDDLRWTGRKGYGARALVGACLVKSLYGLPTWTRTASLIEQHLGLQAAIEGCPSVWACYRFTTKLREHSDKLADCLDRISESLQNEFSGMGENIAIDGSNLPAFASGRDPSNPSDSDASWGHRSAISTRGAGTFYGYKLHAAVCTETGLPLAWRVETARRHESLYAADLLNAVRGRGYAAKTCAMDKGYDYDPLLRDFIAADCIPIVPLRKRRTAVLVPLSRNSERFLALARNRVAVERAFGALKLDYSLATLRVRGIQRVRLHVDLVMLARLAQSLSRARAVSLAA